MSRDERYEHGLQILQRIDGETGQKVIAVYRGMPRGLNATFVAKKVFAERDLLPVSTPAA
jgi:hypothetical protein